MKPIKNLNNGEHITIHLFGKEKDVEVFSTGDNQFDDNGNDKPAGFALSEEEVACLNWFIENVKIEDYRQEIAEYCNERYDEMGEEPITESDVEKEITISAIAINISEITQSADDVDYPEISFFGDCKCDPEQGICIGFRDKRFLGIDAQDWTL